MVLVSKLPLYAFKIHGEDPLEDESVNSSEILPAQFVAWPVGGSHEPGPFSYDVITCETN